MTEPILEAVTPSAAPAARPARRRLLVWIAPPAVLVAGGVVAALGTGYRYGPPPTTPPALAADLPSDIAALRRSVHRLQTEQRQLQARLLRTVPTGLYVVIDQTQNRLYLKDGDRILLKAVCSAGSGMVLQEEGGKNRRWVFDTPRGAFKVLSKIEDPIWKKPDWAFIEEGKPIPRDPEERFESGTLGEYALYFGNGYLIHGTLYERLLGRSVTHGCIRLGRDDLRIVYKQVPVGTPVYIY